MKSWRAASVAAALAAAGLGGWWLLQEAEPPHGAAPRPQAAPAAAAAGPIAAVDPADAAGRRPAAAGAPADPFLTADLRYKLEAMLLEAGEAGTPAALKQRLAGLVTRHFSSEQATRALALAERYVDYRVALGDIQAPADLSDPRALRAAVQARQLVREKHFAGEEYQALFAQEEELDRFTLARLEIERNAGLTRAQKQAAIRDAELELSQAQRAARSEAVAHLAVAAQTAAFDTQGVSDQARHAQRSAQHGEAAAQRLAQLDREERDWQQRLSQYAAARDARTGEDQLQQLRRQLFSPEEQLRIEAALLARKTQ